MLHSNSAKNHKIENWTYANAAARTGATGFVSGDVGKIAYQTDTSIYWRLTATTPTWVPVAVGIPSGGSTDQVLAKSSGTDYAVAWATPSGGGGSGMGLKFTWLTSTTDTDPTSGKMSGDDTPDSATYIRFNKTDGNGHSVGTLISQWLSYAGNAYVIIQGLVDPSIFVVLAINKKTDSTTYWKLFTANGGPIAADGTFTNNQVVSVQFLPAVGTQYEKNLQPADPTGTTDTTGKMMGLGHSPSSFIFIPQMGSVIFVTICGTVFNSGGVGDGAKITIYAGTGSAPANGAALTGSPYSTTVQYISSTTAGKVPFSLTTLIVPVVANTTYWIDLGLAAITGGTATVTDLQLTAFELLA